MVEMVPTKLDRVRDHTDSNVNAEIDSEIVASIRHYSTQPEHAISARINQLDREWDVERILEANASTIAFIGTLLGAFVNPWFLLIPGTVTAFLFQHATQGWCPPLPIIRRMGKRTRNEIDVEKFAMKALRGDFDRLNRISEANLADRVIHAVAAYNR